jgi:hypothetical protein
VRRSCASAVPWDHVRFLEYATDRVFLRRVGGGYAFVHRPLQEHFADPDTATPERHPLRVPN